MRRADDERDDERGDDCRAAVAGRSHQAGEKDPGGQAVGRVAAWEAEAVDMNELGIELGPDAAEQQFEAVDR